jgi:hypothetical protein
MVKTILFIHLKINRIANVFFTLSEIFVAAPWMTNTSGMYFIAPSAMQAALVSSVSLHLTPDFIKFKVENNDSHE